MIHQITIFVTVILISDMNEKMYPFPHDCILFPVKFHPSHDFLSYFFQATVLRFRAVWRWPVEERAGWPPDYQQQMPKPD